MFPVYFHANHNNSLWFIIVKGTYAIAQPNYCTSFFKSKISLGRIRLKYNNAIITYSDNSRVLISFPETYCGYVQVIHLLSLHLPYLIIKHTATPTKISFQVVYKFNELCVTETHIMWIPVHWLSIITIPR